MRPPPPRLAHARAASLPTAFRRAAAALDAALAAAMVGVLLALWPAGGAAQTDRARAVPPSPAPASFIADGGPVLDAAARGRLDARIAAVQRETGGDVGVAIIPDLAGGAPQEVAVEVYRAWRIGRVDSLGSARRDLGALLLIVPKELAPDRRGECFVLTGRGAEGELHDADAGALCRDSVIPHLRTRAYEAAVAAGVDGIAASFRRTTAGLDAPAAVGGAPASGLEASYGADRPDDGRGAGPVLALVLAATVGAGGAAAAVRHRRRHRPRPCPNGCGPMVRLGEAEEDAHLSAGQRSEERVGSVDYDAWVCRAPNCGAHLVLPYRRWSSYAPCPSCRHRTVSSATRTLRAATYTRTGVEEVTRRCANCHWNEARRHTTPVLPPPSSSGGSSGSSGGGSGLSFGGGGSGGGSSGSSFGGSGATSGGGGGSSY